MSEHDPVWERGEDVQVLDNVLQDTSTPPNTRRMLLKRASIGLLGVGALGVATGCGSSSSTSSAVAPPPMHHGKKGHKGGGLGMIEAVAATAEALAVTYISGLVQNADTTGVTKFVPVLKAVNASEYDHYKALDSLGAKPLTTKFWVPDVAFKKGKVFPIIERLETLFVNAYLIHSTVAAKAGKDDIARYSGEILGVEAEHLALARFAENELPNDYAFMPYDVHSIGGIVKAIEKLGIGLGKKGAGSPGKFYTFPGQPPSGTTTTITNNTPQ
jgi:hypothetical protein